MPDIIRGLRNFIVDPASRAVLGTALAIMGIGTVFYRWVEGLTWIDSLYFSVVTLTTVGYGDISPATTAGKLFTMAYVIIGIGVFVALVSTIAHHLIEAKRTDEDDPVIR